MKAKMIKILLLVVALIICLSVALYAAHSYSSQANTTTTPSVAADTDNELNVITPTKGDKSWIRKAN